MKIKINKFIGAHVSTVGGLDHAVMRAYALQATAFALFTKNQRQWKAATLTSPAIDNFYAACERYHYTPMQILPHNSYLINLGHPSQEILKQSRTSFINEIYRCMQLGLNMLNFHPGNHLNQINEQTCLTRIADSINIALEKTADVTLVIENTAGQGSCLGFYFEQIASIINQVEDKSRIGVCIDTCHAFAAGYDLSNEAVCAATFNQFADIVGFHYLRGVHLNDAKAKCGSRVDRHHSLGAGMIGKTAFTWLMADKRFDGIPMILETIEPSIWPQEIAWLQEVATGKCLTKQNSS